MPAPALLIREHGPQTTIQLLEAAGLPVTNREALALARRARAEGIGLHGGLWHSGEFNDEVYKALLADHHTYETVDFIDRLREMDLDAPFTF